jgi:hypothetical protein
MSWEKSPRPPSRSWAEPEDLLNEIAERYDGKVVVGSDLDIFE